jgi:hypothetical protein
MRKRMSKSGTIFERIQLASLRDKFAGQALNGMLASTALCDRTKVNKLTWATVAFEFADAMLLAREKPIVVKP